MNTPSRFKTILARQSVQLGILAVLAVALVIIIIVRVSSGEPRQRVNRNRDIVAVADMVEQTDGDYTYRFDSIAWTFDNEQSFAVSPETKVGFQFDNFSRRDAMIPAVFSKPFFVGMYDGACSTATELPAGVSAPFADSETCSDGPLVAVAVCGSEEIETPIAIHQCGMDLVVSDYADGTWNTIRTLQMSEIIK